MKRPISTDKAPGAIGPYSQAVRVGDMLFVSGQIPLDPKTGKFPEGIEAQTRQSLTNVRSILEAAGGTMDSVVKTTVFLSDMNNFAAMNAVYGTFFTEGRYPARSAVEVARIPKDALVEVEVIAQLSVIMISHGPQKVTLRLRIFIILSEIIFVCLLTNTPRGYIFKIPQGGM